MNEPIRGNVSIAFALWFPLVTASTTWTTCTTSSNNLFGWPCRLLWKCCSHRCVLELLDGPNPGIHHDSHHYLTNRHVHGRLIDHGRPTADCHYLVTLQVGSDLAGSFFYSVLSFSRVVVFWRTGGQCRDQSSYCGLVQTIQLCYIPRYRQHCCQTCRHQEPQLKHPNNRNGVRHMNNKKQKRTKKPNRNTNTTETETETPAISPPLIP